MVTIKTSEAAITTAQVELRTIMVGKKQMTCAVYRQLPVGHLFSWNLQGDSGFDDDVDNYDIGVCGGVRLWGYVNYCLPDCKCTEFLGEHFHVVGERDGILRVEIVASFAGEGDGVYRVRNWQELRALIVDVGQLHIAV